MAHAVGLDDLVEHLDALLRVRELPDYAGAWNGLQVENAGRIDRLVAAVDASQATIDGVVAALARDEGDVGFSGDHDRGSPLLLVHHGLFWDGQATVTGRRYRRLRTLLHHDIALYAAHLPLDLHPEVGNNAVLARALGLELRGTFGSHKGVDIGVWGELPASIASRDALLARLAEVLGLPLPPRLVAGGPERPRRVGIVTGGAGGLTLEARAAGLDTLVTGEGAHHTYFDAMEGGVNLILAGHYATETVGVRALGEHLARQFGLPVAFHDHPTGL
ncbi:MAG: Nif3-like dinuclear metal center hexameric protein [Gemmatimonadales bacterium]|nr:Nif3-like dinuclear metal center hexameric protein [Gemmatimonadales bacterium]